MGPGVFGAGVTQLNLVISTALASLLPGGSVSYLYYADRLNQLPLGVVGIAVGTAILPPLSRQVRIGDAAGAAATQNRGVELALLLTLPAAAALVVLAEPILAVLFQRGAFGPADGGGDRGGARRLCRRAAGLRPGQGAGAGLFRPPRHRDAGQGRGRRDGAQSRADPGADAASSPMSGWRSRSSAAGWMQALTLLVLLARHGHFRLDRRAAAQHAADRRGDARHGARSWWRCASLLGAGARRPGVAAARRAGRADRRRARCRSPRWRSRSASTDWRELRGQLRRSTGLTGLTRTAAAAITAPP